MRFSIVIALGVALYSVLLPAARGQALDTTPEYRLTGPGVNRAVLRFRLLNSYGAGGTRVLDTHPGLVVRAETGDLYFVTARFEPARIDSASRAVQLLGEVGNEPGDYRTVTSVAVEGDTVVFYDLDLNRQTRFDRSSSSPLIRPFYNLPFGDILAVGGRRFVNGSVPTPDLVGFPLFEVDSEGRVIRSFGTEAPVGPRAEPWGQRARLSMARHAVGFWAVYQVSDVIEHYDLSAHLTTRLVREAPWLPRDKRFNVGNYITPPSPLVLDAREDSLGRLWVLTRVADPHWKRGFARRVGVDGRLRFVVSDFDKAYDTLIDVIDVVTWKVVLSQRTDRYFFGFLGDGLLGRYVRRGAGQPALELWRVIDEARPLAGSSGGS